MTTVRWLGHMEKVEMHGRAQWRTALQQALRQFPSAKWNFGTFPGSSRNMLLHWELGARTDTTRKRRIATAIEMAGQNERANIGKA